MSNGLYAAIAQGGQPIQIENPVNQMAKIMAIKNAQQEQQLNALKMQEAQRGIAEEEELRNYLRGVSDLTSPDVKTNLLKYGTKGLAYGKALSEQEKAGLETRKLKGEITAQDLKRSQERLDNLFVNPSNENIIAHLQDDVAKNLITPEFAQQQWARYSGMTPDQRKQEFQTLRLGVSKYTELNKPTLRERDVGGAVETIAIPGLGGAATVVPGSRATKGLTPEQAREAGQERNIVARTETDAEGNITALNKFGQVIQITNAQGQPVAVKGKPSATFEKTQAQRQQLSKDLDTAIFELKDAIKPKGLIEQSTGSGAGRLVDIAAGFVGQATPGAIATAKLKPIADLVLKMVPRFEGPQSDKDTQSYKEAAGQLADPTLPNDIRKAAASTLIRLMQNRKGQFVTTDMATEGTTASGGVDMNNPLLKK